MATISKGYTFGTTEQVTAAKLHSLIESATISSIQNSDIDSGASIADTKLAAIATANKVSGTALYGLSNIPAGAGEIPSANLPATTPDSDATLTFTDITTNNASTTKHGFLKKLSNVATEFMNGVGNWVPVTITIDSILPSQTGNSGKFLTTNGTSSSWGSVVQNVSSYASGTDVTVASATTERNDLTTSYVKYKEAIVERTGTVTVTFDLRGHDGNPANTGIARIYTNGVASGTERTVISAVYQTYSENISVSAGDLVQLYAKKGSAGATSSGIKNFYIKRAYTEGVILD